MAKIGANVKRRKTEKQLNFGSSGLAGKEGLFLKFVRPAPTGVKDGKIK